MLQCKEGEKTSDVMIPADRFRGDRRAILARLSDVWHSTYVSSKKPEEQGDVNRGERKLCCCCCCCCCCPLLVPV
jgi:hypothetical protein